MSRTHSSDRAPGPSNLFPETPAEGAGGKSKGVRFQSEIEVFQPSYETFTPQINKEKIKYRAPDKRQSAAASVIAPPSSVSKPNIDDALRRISVVSYQHIGRCENRRLQAEQMQEAKAEAVRLSGGDIVPETKDEDDEDPFQEDLTELFGEEKCVAARYYVVVQAIDICFFPHIRQICEPQILVHICSNSDEPPFDDLRNAKN
jgi:hypothetical protein